MTPYSKGFVIGLLCAIVVITVLKRRYGKKKQVVYDERQLIAQGKAYKTAFMSMLICGAALMVFNSLELPFVIASSLEIFLMFTIGVVVFVVKCVMNDAYFGINAKPAKYLITLGVLVLINLPGLALLPEGFATTNGKLTLGFAFCANLLVVLELVVIGIAVLVRSRKDCAEDLDDWEETEASEDEES